MTRAWWAVAAAAMPLLVGVQPLLAQDGGGGKSNIKTAFQMFFWSKEPVGLIITWFLIFMSFCVMALVIKHVMDNKVAIIMPAENVAEYEALLGEKKFRDAIERASNDPTVFGQVMHASLSEAANGYGAMERAIEESTDLLAGKRIRGLELLNVLGATGPMVGLFGTIYGMIVAFQVIVEKGGQPNPAELAGGISTALVTTFWGLIVGIPAVAGSALIRSKIDGLMVEAMIQAEMLISQFQPGARKTAAAAGGGAAAAPKPKTTP